MSNEAGDLSLITLAYNSILQKTDSPIPKKMMGLFLDMAVLWGSWQIFMAGAGYFKHFYRHQIMKNIFGIEPPKEEEEPEVKQKGLQGK